MIGKVVISRPTRLRVSKTDRNEERDGVLEHEPLIVPGLIAVRLAQPDTAQGNRLIFPDQATAIDGHSMYCAYDRT
jgi:hypothetical protein